MMNRQLFATIAGCVVILHTPDGGNLYLEEAHITAVRPASQVHVENLAKGTKSVVYGVDENFGVIEEATDVVKQIEACNERDRRH
jgi:hypothetical protein